MSHFTVLCVGEGFEEQLELYSENNSVPEYFEGFVSDDNKQSMLNYYMKHNNFSGTFDECYDLYGHDWNHNNYKKNEDDIWCRYSTYNPLSKWDCWTIGGRWDGLLLLKDGTKVNQAYKAEIDFDKMRQNDIDYYSKKYDDVVSIISQYPKAESFEYFKNIYDIDTARTYYTNQEQIKAFYDIDGCVFDNINNYYLTKDEYLNKNVNDALTFAILKDYEWYERGEMGYWACVSNEKDTNVWSTEYKDILDSINDDELLTIVDCHI